MLKASKILADFPHHAQVHSHMFHGLVGKTVIDHVAIDIKAIVIGEQCLSLSHGELVTCEHKLGMFPLQETGTVDKGHCSLRCGGGSRAARRSGVSTTGHWNALSLLSGDGKTVL